jgi:hypothetical protein
MGLGEDLRRKWDEMDEIDRKNLYIAVFFFILIIVMLIMVGNTLSMFEDMVGGGAQYVNDSIGKVEQFTATR